jgi:multidrug efflux pump subunit AcrB
LFSKFFINRPIFASVLSIVIVLAGFISVWTLPIAQYPDITPPTVEVSASYPGANAQVVADTVAAPIEQQVNGVENMMYMSSQCTNDGTYTLTVTFVNGTDLNIAQVLVQNRVNLATPILPDLVKRRGVTVKKKSPNVLMIVNLSSPDGSRDNLYLSNYATIQLKDELSRLKGVGDISYLGQRDYSMRVWLDPQKLASRNLTCADVTQAIEQQNIQVATGQLGQPPTDRGQVFQFTMSTMGRLTDDDQFRDMLLKTDNQGRLVRLGDVAQIQLGALSYDQASTLDGTPSVALSIYQLPGSNALEVARQVRAKMEELKTRFPEGVDYTIVYDTTPFINESITEVRETLIDAVVLVALVVLVFLQNWRSAIIPLIAVPVAVVGTFAAMAAMGFSLNLLTLFGLVLAIGIVVDDAIVVVEAVERQIEHGLPPREATVRAMEQVSGPVVAIGLVLSAVFVPAAFMSGIIGQFFRQFALTIAVSTVISAFNSLTLSPALAALLLRPRVRGVIEPMPAVLFGFFGAWVGHKLGRQWPISDWTLQIGHFDLQAAISNLKLDTWGPIVAGGVAATLLALVLRRPLNSMIGWLFRTFDRAFEFSVGAYIRGIGRLLRVSVLALIVYGGLLALTAGAFNRTPKGFIPTQDKGYLLVNVQLPDSASVLRTERIMRQIEKIALGTRGVSHTVAVTGQSILLGANAPHFGAMFVMLDEFPERVRKRLSGDVIAARLEASLREQIPEASVNVFGAPPLEGLSTAGGFKIMIEDRGDTGLPALQDAAEQVVARGNQTPGLAGLYTSFRANRPWLDLRLDRIKAKTKGVSMSDIWAGLQDNFGSFYVNDFNLFGRTWQVNVQAAADFRGQIQYLNQIKVKNDSGRMVPLGTLVQVREKNGPAMIVRYNMYPSAAINGSPAAGVSSGQAIERMAEAARPELGRTMRFEWTELALLQLQSAVTLLGWRLETAMLVFLLAVVLVFLVLAAQYESWSLPLAVILVVPMCLLCSITGVLLARLDINIFTQVGFVVLIGLACKNAILIVEFAKKQRESGLDPYQATLAACQLRLRPIIMTSFAFILGVVPLVISRGAGAEMRRTLGTAVFSGMLGVTLFGIFLTPVFYFVIQWLIDLGEHESPGPDSDGPLEAVKMAKSEV